MFAPELDEFLRQNPKFDLDKLSFRDSSTTLGLNFHGLDRESVICELKRLKRVRNLHRNPAVAALLLGHPPTDASATTQADMPPPKSSAHEIVQMPRSAFVRTYAPHLPGDGTAVANEVYNNAVGVQARVAHQLVNLTQLRAPYTSKMAATAAPAPVVQHYAEMPSYADLFKGMDYCKCEECQSIFGPAAYFVDLMRIIDKYATQPNAKAIPANMKLAERRPDLAMIPLTCDNTNQLLPYLTIVNQRLELVVAGNSDPYPDLAKRQYPFELPFQLHLERLRIYLGQLKVSLASLYLVLEPGKVGAPCSNDVAPAFIDTASQARWAAELLGMSSEEWALITQPQTDMAKLAALFGVSDVAKLADPTIFCAQTNLRPVDVLDLFDQNLSDAEKAAGLRLRFTINQGATAPVAIQSQDGVQTIVNLVTDASALDRVLRFLRLAAKLGWSFQDLDWALSSVAGGTPAINADTLCGLACLKTMADQMGLSVGAASALIFDLRTYGAGDGSSAAAAPFDRAFNRPGGTQNHPTDDGAPSYRFNPTYKDHYQTWTIGATDTANTILATWVAAGLGLRADDLMALMRLLYPLPQKATSGPDLKLTVGALSTLWRHVSLAGVVQLPVRYYARLRTSLGLGTGLALRDIANVIEQAGRLRRSRMTVFELDYIITRCRRSSCCARGGAADPSVDILYRPMDLDAWLASLLGRVGAAASDQSASQQAIDLTATFFGARSEQIAALLPLTGQADLAPLLFCPSNQEAAKTTIAVLSRLLVLVRKLLLTTDEIASIGAAPAAYGIASLPNLSAVNVLDIFRMKEIRANYGDDAGHVLDYIRAGNDADASKALAALTGQAAATLLAALGLFTDPNAIRRLDRVQPVLALFQKTGMTFDALSRLRTLLEGDASSRWNDYATMADNVLAAVRTLAGGDNWDALFAQLDGAVQERKRTALISTAITKLGQQNGTTWVTNKRNLYEYLLIDVEMQGKTQISKIKEGLNAAQLYLLRCRERLEPGITDFAIPKVWWEWMMNYRIWEANRKVFVYPESYFDPALRPSKTKLFADFENTLKQGDISVSSVQTAFTKYLDGFAELAKLQYVDACYYNAADNDVPTMFFLARTDTQPAKYFYLTCVVGETGRIWSEWKEISVGISSDAVTPIYAFNRLFLFWVEQKQYDEKTDTSNNSSFRKTVKATIKYSFYNFSGDWVSAQTLVADAVIAQGNSTVQTANAGTFPDRLFDPQRLWWKKVYPLKIEQGCYGVVGQGVNKFEKIVLFYGPMLDITGSSTPAGVNSGAVDALTLDFDARLTETLGALVQAKAGGYDGYLPVFPPIVINDDLERGFLVNPNEFLLIARESTRSRTYVRPEIDRSAGTLGILHSDHIMADNYLTDGLLTPSSTTAPKSLATASFVASDAGIAANLSTTIYNGLVTKAYLSNRGVVADSIDYTKLRVDLAALLTGQSDAPKKVDSVVKVIGQAEGTPRLSSAMRHQDYALFTVKNHPMAFVFSGDKEAFLLTPGGEFPAISRATLNPNLLITGATFVSAGTGIQATGSKAIYDLLVQSGYADANGQLDPQMDVSALRKLLQQQLGSEDQVAAVINLMTDSPLFASDAFVAGQPLNITATGSKAVFDALTGQGYLDKNGRLDAEVDFHDLMGAIADTLSGQPNKDAEVRFIVDILYQRASASAVGFFDESAPVIDFEYRYDCVRLTTAAIHRLSSLLFTGGVSRLLSLSSQQLPPVPELPFARFQFFPGRVVAPEVTDGAGVDFAGAYKTYYWELFFHAPLYIANLLKTNQQFEAAEPWYRYIFDPTVPDQPLDEDMFITTTVGSRDSVRIFKVLKDAKIITDDGLVSSSFTRDTPLDTRLNFLPDPGQIVTVRNILLNSQLSARTARFWQFRPFRNHTLELLHDQLINPDEIAHYEDDPFDPDAIAALRIGAYEKAVVMHYVDNLLQWGDARFSEYTWESIVAATMLYISAYNLLGERPENLGNIAVPPAMTFADVLTKYGKDVPPFLLELEAEQKPGPAAMSFAPINVLDCYFCIPENTDFITYWDRVDDRLYKIRHGLNILGIPQPLALFEPPIDPNLLVRAAASGADIVKALTADETLPVYRFTTVMERARQVAAMTSSLGQSLLAALEKQDGEELARLHATQEDAILSLTTLMKQKQIDEMTSQIAALQETRSAAQRRHDFYSDAYNENVNGLELAEIELRGASTPLRAAAIATRGLAIGGYLTPNIFGLADGGMQFGEAVSSVAEMFEGSVATIEQIASAISLSGQWSRRRDDWGLQRDVTQYELNQIDKQIDANQARLDLLNRELITHLKSIDQSDDYQRFLKRKFSNQELYQWMVGRLAALHFQAYRLALEAAFAAQAVYQSELDSTDRFVTVDYWDNLHQGLLAGDALLIALQQLESAYLVANTRTLEIERTISLLQLDPVAFIKFKGGIDGAKKGELTFTFSEALFDFDFPGHYCRKIKAVSVTIPAVVGPYQNINAMLTQTDNTIVVKANADAVKSLLNNGQTQAPDGTIRKMKGSQSVALSRGVNDSGLFVLDFRDERFLPFEGSGAVSSWTLRLPPETNRIDFGSISDIIVKVQYTAKDGSGDKSFIDGVRTALTASQPPYPYQPGKIFDLRQAFAAEWSRFVGQAPQAGVQTIRFALSDSIVLPNLKNVQLLSANVLLLTSDGSVISDKPAGGFVSLTIGGDGQRRDLAIKNNRGTVNLLDVAAPGKTCSLAFTAANLPDALRSGSGAINATVLTNIVVVITYQTNVFAK